MPSAKTKRLMSSIAVGAVWAGATVFVALVVLPRVREALSLYQQVRDAEALLDTRLKADLKPSMGVTMRYQDIKGEMEKEAQACANAYLRQSACLNRKILETDRRWDPYDVGGKFREVKNQLADKAGNPDFLELGTLDDWERQDKGKPRQEDLAEIEKRTCIAAVLVDLLATEPKTVVQLMSVLDPTNAAAPPVPPADWLVVRHRVYPVDVQFTTRFGSLGGLLNQIVTAAPSSANVPCMAIGGISLEATGAEGAGTVKVQLRVDVYDFYEIRKAS